MNTPTPTPTTNNNNNREWIVESSDIIRLIQAYLTEHGLHHSCQVLREESGIGQVGVTSHSNLSVWCRTGQWDKVLSTLTTLEHSSEQGFTTTANNNDNKRKRSSSSTSASAWAIGEVHELAISELAEVGSLDLAYHLFKVVKKDLEKLPADDNNNNTTTTTTTTTTMTKARSLEQRLAAVAGTMKSSPEQQSKALAQLYGIRNTDTNTTGGGSISHQAIIQLKQERRTILSNYLIEMIPELPKGRLPTLLQQSIKWQSYTGQVPWIRDILTNDDDDDAEDEDEKEEDENEKEKEENPKKKKRKKKKRTLKRLDLLLGHVDVEGLTVVGENDNDMTSQEQESSSSLSHHHLSIRNKGEPIPTDPYSSIKFGKSATAECCLFLPDASGLITGSSDGLIEIWDPTMKFSKLRTDLPYQRGEEEEGDNKNDDNTTPLLGHDDGTAVLTMTVSTDMTLLGTGGKDGIIYIWRLDTGKCLRKIIAYSNPTSITCLDFVPDASRIVAGSTGPSNTCREFGLRTSRMLKEFTGHLSTITSCQYVVVMNHNDDDDNNNNYTTSSSSSSSGSVLVVSGSLDGTIRIWHGTTAETLRVLQPSNLASLVVNPSSLQELKINTNPGIVAILHLPWLGSKITRQQQQYQQSHRMIIVPRSSEAIMVDTMGNVLQRYSTIGSGIVPPSSSSKAMAASMATNTDDMFVAACTSPSQTWLYLVTEQGLCHIFDTKTGQWERTIRDFGVESTSKRKSKSDNNDRSGGGSNRASATSIGGIPEITSLIHHPHKGIIAAFSNDKTQKKGLVALWK